MKQIEPYLVGVLFGDGTTNRGKNRAYSIWIDQTDKNKGILEHEVVPRLRKMELNVFFFSYYAESDRVVKWRALVNSKEMFLTLRGIFSRITEYFDALADGGARQFIAGMLDAEGTITDRVVIYNSNLGLLRAMQQRFEVLGIHHSHVYKFGSIHGLQVFRQDSVRKMTELIPSQRLKVHFSD